MGMEGRRGRELRAELREEPTFISRWTVQENGRAKANIYIFCIYIYLHTHTYIKVFMLRQKESMRVYTLVSVYIYMKRECTP